MKKKTKTKNKKKNNNDQQLETTFINLIVYTNIIVIIKKLIAFVLDQNITFLDEFSNDLDKLSGLKPPQNKSTKKRKTRVYVTDKYLMDTIIYQM